jgi:8-oxo-dGTP pyrophosphatase MutT (NUDIX family)
MTSEEEGSPPEMRVRRVRSAGGVVVAGEEPELRVAVMRSRYGTWVFPKGGLRPGEVPEEAARREVGEEIGLRKVRLLAPLGWTEHEFDRDGQRLRKRVDWFLLEADAGAELAADPAENSLDCGWLTPEQALALLTHADQRRLLRRALAAIGRRRTARGE